MFTTLHIIAAADMTSSTTSRRRTYNATGSGYETGRYGDRHMGEYRSLRNETLAEILEHHYGSRSLRILEVGCGTGLTLDFLAHQARRHSLFGLDASDTMLRQAAEKAARSPNAAHLVLGDAGNLPYPDGWFDVVFATRFIHQFSHVTKRALWKEFQRVTRGGGLVVLEFYARPYHWVRYYFGANKGKPRGEYFDHFPSKAEVHDIVAQPFETYPLRLVGSKLFARSLSAGAMRKATRAGGRMLGGALLDEYFLAARKP